MKRAIRRRHLARLKNKRRNYYGGHQRNDPVAVGVWANTACVCSCWMCRNPRRAVGSAAVRLTMQERKWIIEKD